jgi:NADPH-dependent ferric siderophore reductase
VTLAGPELRGLVVEQPAASVRVLLPAAVGGELVIPAWTGNEFLLPKGRRPTLRTLTPRRLDSGRLELDLDVVIHAGGAASDWGAAAPPGSECAVSGPARGYVIDPESPGFFLAGDETAIPAMGQVLEWLPADKPVRVEIEIASPSARLTWPERANTVINWLDLSAGSAPGQALVAAVSEASLGPGTRIWVAGEAAAVQQIRRHLFEARGLPRAHASIHGYWKHGRTGGGGEQG